MLTVFPTRVLSLLTTKRAALAILCFALGAFPLIDYNLDHQWVTFRSNAAYSTDDFAYKARLLLSTLQGDSMLGSLPREN